MSEQILEPDLPIVDPHHHLWDRPTAILRNLPPSDHGFMDIIRDIPRYLLDELLADLTCGHNVRATVYMECGAMYRADGPDALKCVGETEFVNGVAAMTASGIYGDVRACAGIVGHVDLRIGDAAEDVLRSHIAAGHGRFRGIRHSASYDEDPNVLGPLVGQKYRRASISTENSATASSTCTSSGLSFDAWMLEPQLPDLIDLARAFPETTIVLDHVGTPLGIGRYKGKREERFAIWRDNIKTLADCPERQREGRRPADAVRRLARAHGRPRRDVAKRWPRNGSPTSRPASRRSAPSAACSKATSRSTASARPTPRCGTRSSAWRRTIRRTKRRRSSAARRSGCTG